jgi:hypothetical protein
MPILCNYACVTMFYLSVLDIPSAVNPWLVKKEEKIVNY